MRGRVLVIAGSDSGGGAGIQADIKAVMAMGGYATTAVTALTAQNTMGVHGVHSVPPDFVQQQIRVVLDDIGTDAVKTGMLGDAAMVAAVAAALRGLSVPIVVDPVMVAKAGARLLDADAVAVMIRHLLPLATVLTPNIPEAEALTGHSIRDEASSQQAVRALLVLGAKAVLLKGGHGSGDRLVDLLGTPNGFERFEQARIPTQHTHGTGCTLASAIAAGLAQGRALPDAVGRACRYVHAAILAAPGFGAGHGPLNHAVPLHD